MVRAPRLSFLGLTPGNTLGGPSPGPLHSRRRRHATNRRRPIQLGRGWEALEERTLLSAGDPSFETPDVGFGTYAAFRYQPSGSPWTFTGGAGVAGNGSGFTDGNPGTSEGTQVAFLQDTGRFAQAFTWSAGTYTVSFLAAQRANYQVRSQTFQVLIDGGVVGTFTPTGSGYSEYATGSFTVAAGSHTLAFAGLNLLGGDNTAFIDLVRVIPAPTDGIGNPGFEKPDVSVGFFFAMQYQPSETPWVFRGNAGVAANGYFTFGSPPAPEGTQVAFLQDTGSLSQALILEAGTYTVRFQAAQRASQAGAESFQVLVDGRVLGTFTPSGSGYAGYTTGSFTVASGVHTLTFAGLNPNWRAETAFIDQVQVNNPIDEARFFVRQVYRDALGREPDPGGSAYWVDYIERAPDPRRAQIEFAFQVIVSPEFRQRHPFPPDGTPEFDREFVRQCYLVFLLRPPDAGGLEHWFQLLSRTRDYRLVVQGFIDSGEYRARFQ